MNAPETDTPAEDPLARISRQLVGAAHARRRRRRHAVQRAAGAVLTLAVLAGTAYAVRPFADDPAVTAGGQRVALDAGDGRFTVYRSNGGPVCADRPNGRDREGATICAFPGLVIDLLRQPTRTAWVQARVVGDRVVVSGLAAVDARVVVTAPRPGGGAGGRAESGPGGPTVILSRDRSTRFAARPFAVTVPRTGAANVQLSASGATGPAIVQPVPIGASAPAALGGFVQLRYAIGAAARSALRAQTRLQATGVARAQVLGDGDRLTAWVTAAQVGKARAALVPGVLTFYDWEASALMPDGTTVAQGLAARLPRATSISRNGGASSGMRYAAARALSASTQGRTTVVQALDRSGPRAPTDPRARFYVLRGRPALTGRELVDPAGPAQAIAPTNAGMQTADPQPEVRFRLTPRGREAFHALTRTISQRGQGLALPGTPPALAAQHFAVVLDGRLISVPSIDPDRLPDGIDGRDGAVIAGGFTVRSAAELARLLQLGPLPGIVDLSPETGP